MGFGCKRLREKSHTFNKLYVLIWMLSVVFAQAKKKLNRNIRDHRINMWSVDECAFSGKEWNAFSILNLVSFFFINKTDKAAKKTTKLYRKIAFIAIMVVDPALCKLVALLTWVTNEKWYAFQRHSWVTKWKSHKYHALHIGYQLHTCKFLLITWKSKNFIFEMSSS